MSNWDFEVEEPIVGRPGTRGHSSKIFQWDDGWFEEFRDGGPGWQFTKEDKTSIECRVNLPLGSFRDRQRPPSFALPNSRFPVPLSRPYEWTEEGTGLMRGLGHFAHFKSKIILCGCIWQLSAVRGAKAGSEH